MAKSELVVENGRVQCPVRGEIDVERCHVCPRVAGVCERDGVTVVRCKGDVGSFWSSYQEYVGAQ